jgi:glycosyltransferase involved in cell wall biosynthesis
MMQRGLAGFVSKFVTVCEAIRNEIVHTWRISPDHIEIIKNGVDLRRFGGDDDISDLYEELRIDQFTPVFLNIGRSDPIKDHTTLLRAFEIVNRQLPTSRLVLVGGGDKCAIKELANTLEISGALRLLGSRRDIARLQLLGDVYVNTSRYEGMSNTILEAMASRKPILATDVGGNPELVQNGINGYLFPPGGTETLAGLMKRLITDQQLAGRLGQAGRSIAEERHNIDGMIDNYSDLYTKVYSAETF